ncbi:MAG: hypothetical protein WCA46_15435 [Actinocatenispora sp.]
MTTGQVSHLIDAYLADVGRAADCRGVAPSRRAELLAELAEHIAVARAESGTPDDEATVRTVLDRLGEPAEIVGQESLPLTPPAPALTPPVPPATGRAGSKPSRVPLVVLLAVVGVLLALCGVGVFAGGAGMFALRPWHLVVLLLVAVLIITAIVLAVRFAVSAGRRR